MLFIDNQVYILFRLNKSFLEISYKNNDLMKLEPYLNFYSDYLILLHPSVIDLYF